MNFPALPPPPRSASVALSRFTDCKSPPAAGEFETAWFISSLVAFDAIFTLVSPFSSDSDEETPGEFET